MAGSDNPLLSIEDLRKLALTKVKTQGRKSEPWVSTDGYVRCYDDDGKVKLFHRHVMEKFLGRPLTRRATIKFKDGDKTNCDISNLVLVTEDGIDLSKIVCPHCHKPLT